MTTPQELIDASYGYSLKTQPQETATENPELRRVIGRSLQALSTIAASVNPTFFGVEATVSPNSGNTGWDEPDDAESIFYVEDASGEEVITVPVHEKGLEPQRPGVYTMGRTMKPRGESNDPDPSADNLTVFYAKELAFPPDLVTDLDAAWDESHDELLIQQLAIYIATKDIGSQAMELEVFRAERNRELSRFIRRLENQMSNVRSRFGPFVLRNDQSVVNHIDLMDRSAVGGGG